VTGEVGRPLWEEHDGQRAGREGGMNLVVGLVIFNLSDWSFQNFLKIKL
jgi:hypothetical protein